MLEAVRDLELYGPLSIVRLTYHRPSLVWWLLKDKPRTLWQVALGRVDVHLLK